MSPSTSMLTTPSAVPALAASTALSSLRNVETGASAHSQHMSSRVKSESSYSVPQKYAQRLFVHSSQLSPFMSAAPLFESTQSFPSLSTATARASGRHVVTSSANATSGRRIS